MNREQRRAKHHTRKSAHKPTLISIPMTGLRNVIALHMHASLAALEMRPNVDSFDSLAGIINMVGLAISGDPRYPREFRIIDGAARAMQEVSRLMQASVPLSERHLAPVRVAVDEIDRILPQLDVSRLYLAERVAVSALRSGITEVVA